MDQVKLMVDAGVSLPTAIKEALGQSVTAWADTHRLSRPTTSEVLNCERSPRLDVCRALETDLGSSAYEWALMLWEAARPMPERFSQATSDTAAA